jgi:DnaK suppressor protein
VAKSAAEWRAALLVQRSTVEVDLEAGAAAAEPVELDQTRVGRVSRMDAMQAQAMSVAANRRRHTQLVRIDAALARLDGGEFGVCVTCAEEIPERRLEIDPTILQCIACAEQAESS